MRGQPDQKQPDTNLTFYEAVVEVIQLWNQTPVAVPDQQLTHEYALLQAMDRYIRYRREKGQLATCDNASEFLERLGKGF